MSSRTILLQVLLWMEVIVATVSIRVSLHSFAKRLMCIPNASITREKECTFIATFDGNCFKIAYIYYLMCTVFIFSFTSTGYYSRSETALNTQLT